MQRTVNELAALVGGVVEGDGRLLVHHPAKIEEAGPGSISFLGNTKYEPFVYSSAATALLVPQDFVARRPYQPTLIRVAEVYTAVSTLLAAFHEAANAPSQLGIAPTAQVAATAKIEKNVSIGHFSVVGSDSQIGQGTRIGDQVFIGPAVQIGEGCLIHPGVRILHGCQIGNAVVIHPNTVIGSDGFGFAPQADGSYEKVPQVGIVILEDGVEIGSNCSIDRATMGATIIRCGAKLDNLIQIGHNVEIGAHTVIAAQTGVAGSTKIGAHCKIGGQTGFAGHLQIADYSNFQAQSGVMQRVKDSGGSYFGSPAIPYANYMKSSVIFKQLPEIARTIQRLEKELQALRKEE